MADNDSIYNNREREGDDMDEEGGEEDPIRLMARDCNELIDESLSRTDESGKALPFEVLHFVKEYQRRFEGWCSFLGVFAFQNASLDYRLRRHPSLQDMILRLLDILRENLSLVTEYESLAENMNVPDNKTAEQIVFSGIKESIHRLNKLAVVIRSSSRTTATARARRFASQYVLFQT
jgi:hypothetical protein